MNTSSDESENEGEKEMDIHAWGQNKKNYYGGIEDVRILSTNYYQDINEDGLEMQETRELERNQLEALKEDDFAVSEDEDDEDEEKDAKMNLGVCYFH